MLSILVTFVVGLALAWFGEGRIIDIRTNEAYAEISDQPHSDFQKNESERFVTVFALIMGLGIILIVISIVGLVLFLFAQTWVIDINIHFR